MKMLSQLNKIKYPNGKPPFPYLGIKFKLP